MNKAERIAAHKARVARRQAKERPARVFRLALKDLLRRGMIERTRHGYDWTNAGMETMKDLPLEAAIQSKAMMDMFNKKGTK